MSAKTILTSMAVVGAAMVWAPAAQAYSFCQLPNQATNGALEDMLWVPSDTWIGNGSFPAENVSVATEVSVIRVRWWGIYVDGATIAECPAPASDDFEIRLYEDDGSGLPGTLIHESLVGAVTRQETGLTLIDPIFLFYYTEYQYEADLDEPVALTPQTGYWLSIVAVNAFEGDTCYWAWETAPAENHSVRWWPPSEAWEVKDYDMAYCLFDGGGVPAVSTWGVLALTLLLMVAGTVVLRRRAAV